MERRAFVPSYLVLLGKNPTQNYLVLAGHLLGPSLDYGLYFCNLMIRAIIQTTQEFEVFYMNEC